MGSSSHTEEIKLSVWFIIGDDYDCQNILCTFGDESLEGSDVTYSITFSTQEGVMNVKI